MATDTVSLSSELDVITGGGWRVDDDVLVATILLTVRLLGRTAGSKSVRTVISQGDDVM